MDQQWRKGGIKESGELRDGSGEVVMFQPGLERGHAQTEGILVGPCCALRCGSWGVLLVSGSKGPRLEPRSGDVRAKRFFSRRKSPGRSWVGGEQR